MQGLAGVCVCANVCAIFVWWRAVGVGQGGVGEGVAEKRENRRGATMADAGVRAPFTLLMHNLY